MSKIKDYNSEQTSDKNTDDMEESIRTLHRSIEYLCGLFEENNSFDASALADCNDKLWDSICLLEGCPFYTSKGLEFYYKVKGNEIFVDRKEKSKSITRSSVELAFYNALQLIVNGQDDFGPKKLKVFGASYIWSIFKRLDIKRNV